jgi:RNA polymerase sigma-70 factor (ECF subfamily)
MLRVGRQEDAADLTHDAFAKTIASPPGSDSPGGGATNLHTVAGNLLRDRWRRDRRAAAGNVRLAADARLTAAGADSLAIAGIETAAVRVAVASLPQEHQDVLRLRIVDGRTSDEVARMLGREPASVRQIQRRALAQLRKELTAKGWAPDTGMAEEPAPGIIQARKRHEEKQ